MNVDILFSVSLGPLEIDDKKTKDDVFKSQFRFGIGLNEIWDIPGSISSQQLTKDKNNKENLLDEFRFDRNKTSWPLTKPRHAHKNKDVFIARVNDPFGHSTKWSFKNSTKIELPEDDRKKRAIGELYSMIKCSTGCDPLIYKGYGCYCGFLGSGIPVNGIDRCCKLHDKCYEHSDCVSYLEYFVPYIWKCYRGKPLCALDHGEWGGPNSCAARLCQCDLQLSRCLRKFICPQRRALCKSSAVRTFQNFLMIF